MVSTGQNIVSRVEGITSSTPNEDINCIQEMLTSLTMSKIETPDKNLIPNEVAEQVLNEYERFQMGINSSRICTQSLARRERRE